ncbi:hypothetical protein AV530_013168 [Patagioenas fasciata monilis]|uniref:G-protein coupled receptors family 1 profile domain-containing protein n=1 Tax=Patagioenas fasciata monilis TaxID=372326 RepID=A0A1V4KCG6_PATFA|nr:hypothetical protein AV530_013168 [Patagioenas fasciata monilis]
MQRAREAREELPDDFYIPAALDAPNLTALSPFLVPQTHLGSPGVFRGMAAFMLALIALGGPINALTIACTARYKKLRSHLNYILVNLAAANLLVICVGSTTAFYSFSQMYFALGPTACKIEGFAATLGAEKRRHRGHEAEDPGGGAAQHGVAAAEREVAQRLADHQEPLEGHHGQRPQRHHAWGTYGYRIDTVETPRDVIDTIETPWDVIDTIETP